MLKANPVCATSYSNSKIARAWSFIMKVRNELEHFGRGVSSMNKRKMCSEQTDVSEVKLVVQDDVIRKVQFVPKKNHVIQLNRLSWGSNKMNTPNLSLF